MTTAAIDSVPLLDVPRDEAPLHDDLQAVFERVLHSGRYILGPEVDALEQACADYIGTAHAIGVSSGSDAVLAPLMALGIGPGDEVVCPTFTFFATAGAISRVGATPVFVDVDPVTFNAGAEQFEPALCERTKAVLPVHLFGQAVAMPELVALASSRGIAVIEDAAQAIGARYEGQGAGAFGDCGCFSFYPTKNLGALGDAGLITTNDDQLAHRLRILRQHGMEPRYYHSAIGGNFRIDALQAALLRVKLRNLEDAHAKRRHNADRYTSAFEQAGLTAAALTPPRDGTGAGIWNQYTIRVHDGKRDALREHLTEKRVGTEIYYPVPLHLQECYAGLGYAAGAFPIAEKAATEVLSLPIFPSLRTEEIDYVVAAVCEFYR